MMNNTISIVMPVYNSAKFLRNSLNSVVNQTYKALQIIIINDGSTDSSKDIIDEFASKDKRIEVFDIVNSGQSFARNMGLSAVKGSYIFFMDADDIIELSLVEKLADFSFRENAKLVSFGNDDVSVSGEVIKTMPVTYQHTKKLSVKQALTMLFHKDLSITPWSLFISSEIDLKNIFPVGRLYEDEIVTPKIMLMATEIWIFGSERPLYHYLIHENSTMGSSINPSDKQIKDVHFVLENSRELYGNTISETDFINGYFQRIYSLLLKLRSPNVSSDTKIQIRKYYRPILFGLFWKINFKNRVRLVLLGLRLK